jgi:hypothetical protein
VTTHAGDGQHGFTRGCVGWQLGSWVTLQDGEDVGLECGVRWRLWLGSSQGTQTKQSARNRQENGQGVRD